ncbi:hypothetical protein OF83DRAFT_1174773 [Amylostereum chailletii]|nr:hypothetical protein OF83DRAFT_1174773 [Amylostereum chailletii]
MRSSNKLGLFAIVSAICTISHVVVISNHPGASCAQLTFDDSQASVSSEAQKWTIKGLRRAALTPEESVHYRVETPSGISEWATSLPRGRGVVHSSASEGHAGEGQYRLAMFHQLECLDVVRQESSARKEHPSQPATERAQFCLNYLRQSIQCHADSHLEMVRSKFGGRAVLPYTTRTGCLDWEVVWEAAERDYDEWKLSMGM